MFYCVKTERQKTERYVQSFCKGANGKIVDYQQVINSNDCDAVAFMGVLRGTNLVYKWAQKEQKNFYYIDRPYWGESRRPPYMMRCVKNEHVKTKLENRPDDRYKKYYKGDIKPYHKNGKYVLVIPPTHSMAVHFNFPTWVEDTVKILKQHTDREIVVREKPYNPKSYLDNDGRLVPGENTTKEHPGAFDWHNIHAVVTFNSSTTIQAFHNGVPCFSNFENPCGPICESDFTKIETPKYDDREPVFHSLAYGQFTKEEFENGWALSILDGK